MAISEKDIKKLWGRAAGHCSAPGCTQDCVPFLDPNDPTVIGEMAHVIPRSKNWTRGDGESAGEDIYENLILLCPTCHTKVDKAPEHVYPRELLRKWKAEHEAKVQVSLSVPQYENLKQLAEAIGRMLTENHRVWKQVGPESDLAKRNPFSAGERIWSFQKLSTVIPNNERIARLLDAHKNLIPLADWNACADFIQHASAFQLNAYDRVDSDAVPFFPNAFGEFVARLNKANA